MTAGTKTLTIERCVVAATGERKDGKGSWTKYTVYGKDTDGTELANAMSWADLPAETGEFLVEDKSTEQYGPSFMIRKAGAGGFSGGSGMGASIDELRKRIEVLEAKAAGPVAAPVVHIIESEDIPF
jgi:hypothetical protein